MVTNGRGGERDGGRGLRACGQGIVMGRTPPVDSEDLGLGPRNAIQFITPALLRYS